MNPFPLADPWPGNYTDVFVWRAEQVIAMRQNPWMVKGAKEYYRTRPIEFIEHWCNTYDPRNAQDPEKLTTMPFILFPKQREMVMFLYQCILVENNGLIEKAREMGATWVCCAFSVWLWLFMDGSSVGWGSRKELYVDKIGNADSIFEKMRMTIRDLPKEFLPAGFNERDHMGYMRILNPANGASITGEAGDSIGRGGRKLVYFKDESAHYERPDLVEASLSATTRVQIDISSVAGSGNAFHKRRKSGVDWSPFVPMEKYKTAVFVFPWQAHPLLDDNWYKHKRADYEARGAMHIFNQEYERNYNAAVSGIIIKAEWVQAAIDADKKLGWGDKASTRKRAALDVADEGGDKNALAYAEGPRLKLVENWGDGDTGKTARRAMATLQAFGDTPVCLQYDSIGVGAGVKAEFNRFEEMKKLPAGLTFAPWNAGAKVLHPERRIIVGDPKSLKNKDFYSNLKAQAWWQLARRFENTWRMVQESLLPDDQKTGFTCDIDDMISIPSTLPNLITLQDELSQATYNQDLNSLKIRVDKIGEGDSSPNMADAVVMAYWPVPTKDYNLDAWS